ncbi:MAG TPA: DUF4007 family protein [Firmicutes bacterium]|nr:DUF4007 family protein [Bacillota bacterium]
MLSLNFHRTFIPERRLVSALLEYVALGKEGTLHQISEETGIPMGKSTGKMPAILEYCKGMGLLTVEPGTKRKYKKPVLTPFGEAVYLNDRLLGEEMTQWLAHLNLCRPDIGALIWNMVFVKGIKVLGYSFSSNQLENYLISHFGEGAKSRTGPLLSVYTDDAALGRAKILQVDGGSVILNKAPITSTWETAYSAIILELLQTFFPGQFQVTITDFATKTGLFEMCLWQENDVETMLSFVERKGFISIDRQIRPWIIEKKASCEDVWPLIFADTI